MGQENKERKLRILSGEEISFKRKSLTQRLDGVLADYYKEYGPSGVFYLDHLTSLMSAHVHNPEGGC